MTAAAAHAPNWASGTRSRAVRPDEPTRFENFVASLGMTNHPEQWHRDVRIRAWTKRHKSTYYVPEWFLHELGIGSGEDAA